MLFDRPFWDPVSVWIVRLTGNDDDYDNGKKMVVFVNGFLLLFSFANNRFYCLQGDLNYLDR